MFVRSNREKKSKERNLSLFGYCCCRLPRQFTMVRFDDISSGNSDHSLFFLLCKFQVRQGWNCPLQCFKFYKSKVWNLSCCASAAQKSIEENQSYFRNSWHFQLWKSWLVFRILMPSAKFQAKKLKPMVLVWCFCNSALYLVLLFISFSRWNFIDNIGIFQELRSEKQPTASSDVISINLGPKLEVCQIC